MIEDAADCAAKRQNKIWGMVAGLTVIGLILREVLNIF